jgi:branched-chain amino acid transport system ATP-binding protein
MLALGRALMGHPRLLLLDEPSMGLAPRVVAALFEAIESLRARGVTMLLVEQNAQAALSIADRGYVLETGRITLEGPGRDLLGAEAVRAAYLGIQKESA